MKSASIISQLPYAYPFLFVDEISEFSTEGIKGNYTFPVAHPIYEGHFINNPITPGVILTECMAQIGVVCLGIVLLNLNSENTINSEFVMTSSNVEYLKPVYPGEKVSVESVKRYFRFNKLKCDVIMKDSEGDMVCKGEIAGMIINNNI
ncbi:3-hydroxyacyl-ACP dehydratase FabZ family protein [Christiangramia aquimixticola]|uniref:3-hydroxyacyl-ACP dehydratase FabZ family protein n=1 Tax=Christiangramia aquimixticola TaxID=1697558 RepID=UPI003AA935AF